MQIPDYDNAMKWRDLLLKLPTRKKVFFVVIGIALLIYCFLVPWLLLKANSKLKDEVAKLQVENAKLQREKAELHRENLHLKEMVGPIQEITKRLYPDIETVTAIAKLNEDIENVRTLATRNVYKPLAEDRREKLIANLKTLRQEYSIISPSVKIRYEQGNSLRGNVGEDLKKYLQQSGWKVDFGSRTSFFRDKTPPAFSIKFNPKDIQFANKLIEVIIPLFIDIDIPNQFSAFVDEKFSRGHLEIKVNGDPLFNDSGVVTFK